MKLIVGLGNPGRIYADSRHNIGFSVVRHIAKSYKIVLKRDKDVLSQNGKCKIGDQHVMLAMPLTFMNLSGAALSGLLKKYRIGLDSLLVICDDLDLAFGRLKLRPSGSSGGQRGLKSAIDAIGSTQFARLRIGIGRPAKALEATEYVLSPFNKKEKQALKGIIEKASLCCETWVTKEVAETMNIYNKRSNNE